MTMGDVEPESQKEKESEYEADTESDDVQDEPVAVKKAKVAKVSLREAVKAVRAEAANEFTVSIICCGLIVDLINQSSETQSQVKRAVVKMGA